MSAKPASTRWHNSLESEVISSSMISTKMFYGCFESGCEGKTGPLLPEMLKRDTTAIRNHDLQIKTFGGAAGKEEVVKSRLLLCCKRQYMLEQDINVISLQVTVQWLENASMVVDNVKTHFMRSTYHLVLIYFLETRETSTRRRGRDDEHQQFPLSFIKSFLK